MDYFTQHSTPSKLSTICSATKTRPAQGGDPTTTAYGPGPKLGFFFFTGRIREGCGGKKGIFVISITARRIKQTRPRCFTASGRVSLRKSVARLRRRTGCARTSDAAVDSFPDIA
jgi:hypothetical protein